MKIKLPMKLKNSVLKAKLTVSKHSPEILLVAGIVGVIGSTVMACIATSKASEIAEDAKQELQTAKLKNDDRILIEDRTPEERRKEIFTIYAKAGAKFIKIYSPAIAVGCISIFSIVSSNGILKKRNKELAAAYSALGLTFAEYRRRVVNSLGEESDEELYYGIKKREVYTEEIDNETGKKKKTKDILDVVEDNVLSPYAAFFERPNPFAEESIRGNIMFLEMVEKKAQKIFESRSGEDKPIPLFLNEVRVMCGLPMIPEGQRAGWLFDEKRTDIDNAIKFRIKTVKKTNSYGDLIDTILLDFNVDGDVWTVWNNS